MKISGILAKVVAGEELTDEEKVALESYEEPNLEAAVNAKGKKERLKLEAQIAALNERLEEKEVEVEEASSGASEMEKLQKQMEKLTAKFEGTQAALDQEKQAHAGTQRSNALKSVAVPWLESVPGAYRDTVMNDAFKDIDTEDLTDPDVIKPIVASIIEGQAGFISAPTKPGTGTPVKESASIPDTGKITAENVGDLKGEALVNNLDAAWAAASNTGE